MTRSRLGHGSQLGGRPVRSTYLNPAHRANGGDTISHAAGGCVPGASEAGLRSAHGIEDSPVAECRRTSLRNWRLARVGSTPTGATMERE